MSSADDGNTSSVLQRLGIAVGDHGDVTSLYVVPNIVHFIWFSEGSSKQLTFINYVSIVSAYRIQKPDRLLFHCNHLPTGLWWDRLWKEVCRHIEVPPYLSRLLIPYHPSRVLTSSCSSNLLQVPRTNLTCSSRSFHAAAPMVWNSLPDSIRSSNTLSSFWHHLKTHYFQAAFNTFLAANPSASDSLVINGALQMYLLTYLVVSFKLMIETVNVILF